MREWMPGQDWTTKGYVCSEVGTEGCVNTHYKPRIDKSSATTSGEACTIAAAGGNHRLIGLRRRGGRQEASTPCHVSHTRIGDAGLACSEETTCPGRALPHAAAPGRGENGIARGKVPPLPGDVVTVRRGGLRFSSEALARVVGPPRTDTPQDRDLWLGGSFNPEVVRLSTCAPVGAQRQRSEQERGRMRVLHRFSITKFPAIQF